MLEMTVAFPAYTKYSIFEWSLIILDILYDSVVARDLKAANLHVRSSGQCLYLLCR